MPVAYALATVSSVNLLIFGTAEGAITIVAASIPILRALLQRAPRRRRRRAQVQENEITDDLHDDEEFDEDLKGGVGPLGARRHA